MKYYELTCLASSQLSELELNDLKQEIEALIKSSKGVLDLSENPKRVTLSSIIDGKKQAYLISFSFSFESEDINKLNKEIKGTNNILRSVLFIKKKPEPKESISKKPLTKEKKIKSKIKLGDIEKKLDEILK